MPEAGGQLVPDALRPNEARLIRARALAWAARMEADGVPLPEVDPPYRGRLRDLSLPLLRVLQLVAPESVQAVQALLQTTDRDRRLEASASWEARVAVALWNLREKVEGGRMYVSTVAEFVNEGVPESERLTAQKVGTARRQLGLRGGKGGSPPRAYVAWPGNETAKALHDRYAPPPEPPEPPEQPERSEVPEGTSAEPDLSRHPAPEEGRKGRKQAGSAENPLDPYVPSDPSEASDLFMDSAEGAGGPDLDLWSGGPIEPDDDGVEPPEVVL